jgi:hypothetical protein
MSHDLSELRAMRKLEAKKIGGKNPWSKKLNLDLSLEQTLYKGGHPVLPLF